MTTANPTPLTFVAARGGRGRLFVLPAFAVAVGLSLSASAAPSSFVVRLHRGIPVDGAIDLGSGVRVGLSRVGADLAVATLPAPLAPAEALRRLRAHPGVRLASPNFATTAASASGGPNDPYFPWQWNLAAIGWERVRPILPPLAATRIALFDTGLAILDWTDPVTGQSYARVPDFDRVRVVPGWDFVDGDATPWDENQHGTHVASVIASTANNALGIAGLLETVELQPIRVLDASGTGSLEELVAGLDWIAERNVDVVNLSLVVEGSDDLDVLADALDRVIASGAVVVAAAGNSHGEVLWPAAYPPVLSVGAVRATHCANGRVSSRPTVYTAWGPRLDLVAPGGDNAMDVDHDGYPDGIPGMTIDRDDPVRTGLWLGAGTSFAAAHVAAIAAILRGLDVSPTAVRQLLLDTADDLPPGGWDVWSGAGVANPLAAVTRAVAGTWSEPRSFTASVELVPSSGNRTEARLTVRDAATGAPAAGVTVYGHWETTRPLWQSGTSDRAGELRIVSPVDSGDDLALTVDAMRVGGAGFIGSITPGGLRFERSLTAVRFASIEPTGREPGCSGQ